MQIRSLTVEKAGPLKRVQVEEMSDVVVFAGPNGVGKTRLNQSILQMARDPRPIPEAFITIEATCKEERDAWKKDILNTRDGSDCGLLRTMLQQAKKRSGLRSSILNFDSDRAIRVIQPYTFQWDVGDPFSEVVGWEMSFNRLHDRYNDVRHSLFRLVEAQKRDIAAKALTLHAQGGRSMPLDFPDVIKPFKDAFWQLLAPKQLVEVSTRDQEIYYETQGQKLRLDELSSGEREVVNIAFDFILRGPSDCVVLFDEPELHLHPELSYKLLQTLTQLGKRNQFIFSTHSPEIITASLENTVVFVSPPKEDQENQAILVHRDDETHHALQALGQSIGIISLGKRLVLIEGTESSLDKQTYGAILKNAYPDLVLVPVGHKARLQSFEDVREQILNRTIWGVDFFLLCDRDATAGLDLRDLDVLPSDRLVQLPRYHLENYFLDEEVLAQVFSTLETAGSWLRSSDEIAAVLREIARTVVPYAVSLNVSAKIRYDVGNVSVMPRGAHAAADSASLYESIKSKLQSEATRIAEHLGDDYVRGLIEQEFSKLSEAVSNGTDTWKVLLPGKAILSRFAAKANLNLGRLKNAYLAAAPGTAVFKDVDDIFATFSSVSRRR